jgi:predicted O-methyltransferase YrrM
MSTTITASHWLANQVSCKRTLEFGSGFSTLAMAMTSDVVSIEGDREWIVFMQQLLQDQGLNADLVWRSSIADLRELSIRRADLIFVDHTNWTERVRDLPVIIALAREMDDAELVLDDWKPRQPFGGPFFRQVAKAGIKAQPIEGTMTHFDRKCLARVLL